VLAERSTCRNRCAAPTIQDEGIASIMMDHVAETAVRCERGIIMDQWAAPSINLRVGKLIGN
jgi:hypothetical protein